MTFIIQNFGPNLARLRIEKGVSQTQLAEDLGIGKQSISDYEKQKSYPTFANLDKIAEYFNATPTQLFGTSKEIELEKSVLESNEYSDKVSEILKAVKYIENFLETDGQYLEDLLYLTRGNQLYTEDGDELYTDPTSQKRTFHNQYEPGFIVARDKSPLELLIENKELFEQNYPAQFISEAVDQTRGWFYTLLAISTAIFDRNPFENCIVLGHVLDKKGLKMSKSKGNVVDPFDVLDAQGADATRWHFYTASAPWLPTRFSIDDVGEAGRKFMGTLWNVYSFYVLYAELDQFNPLQYADFVSENVMDKWIMSKLNTLVKDVEAMLDSYQITQAALDIEEFTDELSNWYVRRNRGRYWTQDLTDDKIGAYVTLYKVLTTVIKVAAPFVPFITENIYQNLVVGLDENAPESIHLCRWPEVDEKAIDKDLEKEMDLAYTIVKLGRSARNGANIKNRQPLSNMLVSTDSLPGYYGDIITDELNIKEVEFGADLSTHVNFEIKPNLPVLGKKYGKLIPVIRKEIAARNQMELAQTIQNGEVVVINVDGNEIELNNENLLVTMQGLEGYAFAGEGSIGVVLDTNITDELREEGHVREMISKIQNMRKDKGFEVADKIKLYVADNDMLLTVIKKYAEVIKKETLTQEIVYNTEADYSDTVINGENLKMTVEVVR